MTAAKTSLTLAVLLFTGHLAVAADEPSYLNYNAGKTGDQQIIATHGSTDAQGVFEPSYVNYSFDNNARDIDSLIQAAPTAAGGVRGEVPMPGTYHENGFFEPGYVNYQFDN